MRRAVGGRCGPARGGKKAKSKDGDGKGEGDTKRKKKLASLATLLYLTKTGLLVLRGRWVEEEEEPGEIPGCVISTPFFSVS